MHHVHPTWAEASPKVSINLKSENPEAGNQREPSRALMPVINKVSPHLHCPAGSRPLWRSQASSQRLPAVILCHSSYQIPRNWYHYRPVTCAMHSFQSLYFSFASSFTCRSSRLCFITWLFAFFILCAGFFQFLKNWYHYGVVTCGNILLHLLSSPQDYHGKMEGSATSDKALFDWEKSSLFGSEGF